MSLLLLKKLIIIFLFEQVLRTYIPLNFCSSSKIQLVLLHAILFSRNDLQSISRLSQVTGDKLKTDNPNVTDLSDPNRPTKLGEMISELYDNEWTDAFEGLQRNGRTDRGSIRILLETFMVNATLVIDRVFKFLKVIEKQ